MPFKSLNVANGPGTLYAAPLGTTEPTSCTGAWPSGWVELGYTAKGSTFTDELKTAAIEVEEEIYGLREVTTGKTATMEAILAEYNEQNLTLALNGGLGANVLPGVANTQTDGTIRLDPPTPGFEQRIMVGWDFLPKGAVQPPTGQVTFGRIIIRQALKTGNTKLAHQKGNAYTQIDCTWTAEVPAITTVSVQPYSIFLPPALAAA